MQARTARCSPYEVVRHPFEAQLSRDWPPEEWLAGRTVLAVSGGADSVGLLRAAAALADGQLDRLTVAHFNHGLRGKESDQDEQFVHDVCQGLKIRFLSERWQRSGESGQRSRSEEAARTARYAFLRAAAEREGARYLAVAHTGDDQAETVLHRVLRGTGLRGLAGMPRARSLGGAVSLIRPLLGFRRSEVLSYLADLGQPYRCDPTNSSSQYTRSRLRTELLPQLEAEYNPAVSEALLRLGALAREAQEVIDELVDRRLSVVVLFRSGDRLVLDCGAFRDDSDYLVRELLARLWRQQSWPEQMMGFAHWQQLAALARASSRPESSAGAMLPGRIHANREGERLVLARLAE